MLASRLLAFGMVLVVGCGGDFEVPPPPDMRISLDLSSNTDFPPPDMTCFNTACGGCSQWANWDGTPSKVGDPCNWKGTYQCMGSVLTCMDASCPTCSGGRRMTGSVCGADGHTILSLTYSGTTCSVHNFGSAINVCNRSASDKCLARCVQQPDNSFNCTASCTSNDGGVMGCEHSATETCDTLRNC